MSVMLQEKIYGILQHPKCARDVQTELGLKGIIISNFSYLRGYLDSLVDINKLHSKDIGGKRTVYSTNPISEYTRRRCPVCNRTMVLFQHDLENTVSCPRCKTQYTAILGIKKGVELVKIEE